MTAYRWRVGYLEQTEKHTGSTVKFETLGDSDQGLAIKPTSRLWCLKILMSIFKDDDELLSQPAYTAEVEHLFECACSLQIKNWTMTTGTRQHTANCWNALVWRGCMVKRRYGSCAFQDCKASAWHILNNESTNRQIRQESYRTDENPTATEHSSIGSQ